MLSAHTAVTLPPRHFERRWTVEVSTFDPDSDPWSYGGGEELATPARR
jgi:hypothetical protein